MFKVWQKILRKKLDCFQFTHEISQADNSNANSRLWIQSDGTVLKQYVLSNDITEKNIQILKRVVKMKQLRAIKQLALPCGIVTSNRNIIGYTMPYCHGVTLEEAITTGACPPQVILTAFESLARVINQLPKQFRIGDLHGKNVLVEEFGEIHIIDIDGCSLLPKYVMSCPMAGFFHHVVVGNVHKYWTDNGMVRVSKDTDIFCFFLLFLRWIMQNSSFTAFSPLEMYHYFDYLKAKGFPNEIVEMILHLSEEGPNLLISEFFQKIDISKLESFTYQQFIKHRPLD